MAKYNVYAVAYGRNPQNNEPVSNLKFYSWSACKPYVVGVEGAKYKGFLTDTEADVWLAQNVSVSDQKKALSQKLPNEECKGSFVMDEENAKKTAETLNKAYENAPESKKDAYFYVPEFYQTCTEMGILPFAMLATLQKQFVEQQKNIKKMREAMGDLATELPFR